MDALQYVKTALRLATDVYDDMLTDMIAAAETDLGIAGVSLPGGLDAITRRAVATYCAVHFGASADADYARLKASYDEQKAQLSMALGYTNF